jgi:drug/metabolite transporter (DMT)-like permease
VTSKPAPPLASGVPTAAALVLGILAVSTASLFIRYAQHEAPSLVIAAGRLGLATLLLAPFALLHVGHRAQVRGMGRGDLGLALLAGVFLALHFATWITSLAHTTVVSSVVLVTTSPLWVALLSPLVLRERLTARTLLGIALALSGGTIVALADAGAAGGGSGAGAGAGGGGGAAFTLSAHALWGDFLALAGAWMMAGYLLVGRRLRARLSIAPYAFVVYGMAAVVLLVAAFASGQAPVALSAPTWGWLLLLALVPQLVGHSTFNWALRHLPAALVAIALLGEPIGSAALAYVFLHEAPAPFTLVGAVFILAGILVASRAAPPVD